MVNDVMAMVPPETNVMLSKLMSPPVVKAMLASSRRSVVPLPTEPGAVSPVR